MVGYTIIVLVTTLIAVAYQNTNNKRFFFFLMVAFPSFFSGFRKVGTDYYVYLERFHYLGNGSKFSIEGTDLTGPFYILLKSVGQILGNYQIAICLIAIITIFVAFYLICQHEDEISIPVAVFSYMTTFYFLSFNIFRQCLAAEIYALGVFLIIKRKEKKRGGIALICAVLLHSSVLPFALSTVILSWISEDSKKEIRFLVYAMLFVGVVSLPEMKIITAKLLSALPHYAFYFLNFNYNGIGIGVFRYIFLVIVVSIILKCAGFLFDKVYVAYTFLAIIGTILTWLSYVSTTFIYRIGYIGLVFLPVLHGYFSKKFLAVYRNRGSFQITCRNTSIGIMGAVFTFGLLVILFFFFWYDYIYLNSGEILPYSICYFMK